MDNKNCCCNSGVRCNVCDCVYNKNNCECCKELVDISLGNGEPMSNGIQKHFCKSFECKTECRPNIEASKEFDEKEDY